MNPNDLPARWCPHCQTVRTGWRCTVCSTTTAELAIIGRRSEQHHKLTCACCGSELAGARVFNESGYDIRYRLRIVRGDDNRLRLEVGLYDQKPVLDVDNKERG